MVKYGKVAVLMGGISSEREVSLRSGAAVSLGLREMGYKVADVVLDSESIDGIIPKGTEAVFIALHGGYGEDGRVQGDLNKMGLPYTGPGAKASAISIDKVLTKKCFAKASIPTPAYAVVGDGAPKPDLSFPLVVKPPRDGSSVGLTCPCREEDWEEALKRASKIDREILVEEYIPGREWTVAVVGERALPVIEISPRSGVYDYRSKYTAGQTQYSCVADDALSAHCRDLALKAFGSVGARGLGRIDFRVTEDGICHALEINTVPGFTSTSLVPKAASFCGISFPELCGMIISSAATD